MTDKLRIKTKQFKEGYIHKIISTFFNVEEVIATRLKRGASIKRMMQEYSSTEISEATGGLLSPRAVRSYRAFYGLAKKTKHSRKPSMEAQGLLDLAKMKLYGVSKAVEIVNGYDITNEMIGQFIREYEELGKGEHTSIIIELWERILRAGYVQALKRVIANMRKHKFLYIRVCMEFDKKVADRFSGEERWITGQYISQIVQDFDIQHYIEEMLYRILLYPLKAPREFCKSDVAVEIVIKHIDIEHVYQRR